MSTPTPPLTTQQPAPEPGKTEYDRLIAYFKTLVSLSLGAITIVLGIAAAFLWKNTSDVKTEADTSIQRTEDSANRRISEIATSASDAARAEAQKAVDAAFEKQNVQRMIESTAQRRVDAAVEGAVQKDLGARIDAFKNLLKEIGEITDHGAQLRMNYIEGLDFLLRERASPDPTIRAFAASTLAEIAADFESRVKEYSNDPKLMGGYSIKGLMEVIRHSDEAKPQNKSPYLIAQAFVEMKKRVNWDVGTFQIAAAEKWCAQHKPKCEE